MMKAVLILWCAASLSAALEPTSLKSASNGLTEVHEETAVEQPRKLLECADPHPIRKVMVTGANGYLASHIVKQLLDKGYEVNACVRDAFNESSVRNLVRLDSSAGKLNLFTTGDFGNLSLRGRYTEPLKGCDAVIHTAIPLPPKSSTTNFDPERDMLHPGMEGTRELLESILECDTSIQSLVLTSSMAAASPMLEPAVKDESHWSDDAAQLASKNYYGCLKTRQERMCHEWARAQKEAGILADSFRFVAICPAKIIGPPVGLDQEGFSYSPSGWMGLLYHWLTESGLSVPNDSMAFIDVRDCAAMHVAAMDNRDASGRYFSVAESWHRNEILTTMKELYPQIPPFTLYEGEPIKPTQFNLKRMNRLGVTVRGMQTMLRDSISLFKDAGLLKLNDIDS
jgi:nucleoside-diphosphate-sugar epimerase